MIVFWSPYKSVGWCLQERNYEGAHNLMIKLMCTPFCSEAQRVFKPMRYRCLFWVWQLFSIKLAVAIAVFMEKILSVLPSVLLTSRATLRVNTRNCSSSNCMDNTAKPMVSVASVIMRIILQPISWHILWLYDVLRDRLSTIHQFELVVSSWTSW